MIAVTYDGKTYAGNDALALVARMRDNNMFSESLEIDDYIQKVCDRFGWDTCSAEQLVDRLVECHALVLIKE